MTFHPEFLDNDKDFQHNKEDVLVMIPVAGAKRLKLLCSHESDFVCKVDRLKFSFLTSHSSLAFMILPWYSRIT